jgi:hypothetical protein
VCCIPPCFLFVTFCGKGRDEGWKKDLGFGGKKRREKMQNESNGFLN